MATPQPQEEHFMAVLPIYFHTPGLLMVLNIQLMLMIRGPMRLDPLNMKEPLTVQVVLGNKTPEKVYKEFY